MAAIIRLGMSNPPGFFDSVDFNAGLVGRRY
jgi:hypothetical protein